MKKVLVALFFTTSFIACKEADKKSDAGASTEQSANAGTPTNTDQAVSVNDSSSVTNLEWIDGMQKDFGKIDEGQNLEVTFRFKNVGSKPLIISNVGAACGCTVPETPKKPYAPGETGEIKASFNSNGKPGFNTKQVYVTANTNPAMTTLVFNVDVKAKSN